MPNTTLKLFAHRLLKKFGPDIIGGLIFGALFVAFALMAVSHEFTKFFLVIFLGACIIGWIGNSIYWQGKIRKADEARRIDFENQRKRWEVAEASVIRYPRPAQVLYDYDKH